ncbi:unnamed protein product [Auanema sp. JU1783]|nr:unnamed protein product [Auanema sp. JU1783]
MKKKSVQPHVRRSNYEGIRRILNSRRKGRGKDHRKVVRNFDQSSNGTNGECQKARKERKRETKERSKAL